MNERQTAAQAAFDKYIEERKTTSYLADTGHWDNNGDIWTCKFWLGSRTTGESKQWTFSVEFNPGTNTITNSGVT